MFLSWAIYSVLRKIIVVIFFTGLLRDLYVAIL